jgi:hypothetical protein
VDNRGEVCTAAAVATRTSWNFASRIPLINLLSVQRRFYLALQHCISAFATTSICRQESFMSSIDKFAAMPCIIAFFRTPLF